MENKEKLISKSTFSSSKQKEMLTKAAMVLARSDSTWHQFLGAIKAATDEQAVQEIGLLEASERRGAITREQAITEMARVVEEGFQRWSAS
jgi:Trp operon repressor